ncbi:MAG: hypothetical protein AB1568_04770 [Thermodesulfobacteriota bacterium]
MPANHEPLLLYRQVKLLGADLVFRLADRAYTATEAEELLHSMTIIAETIDGATTEKQP